ncbi:MAG: LuxR C-terminal-related transcriptional regulator [Spirochaetales bacterium]|nr:LuxR C-terminal-related transcriptional regulator [Spirochaetales bacterium]
MLDTTTLRADYKVTERECQIVEELLVADTNKEVAYLLSISENTLKRHITNIYGKLGTSNKYGLRLFLERNGLLRRSDEADRQPDTPLSTGAMDFSRSDLSAIEAYRELTNTSVLVIMFTDIEGFTSLTEERGERYSAQIRTYHDRIMEGAIESTKRGRIIKHIGDSVMAVFAEPTGAVQTALEIQRNLREFNVEHAELDPVAVRIGLHMGQVSIENAISPDVFGRHVNRAARIESAAVGGQILCSYSVFDSAKGWLAGSNDYAWVEHGAYHLKGIGRACEIFEIYEPPYRRPTRPRLKRYRAIRPIIPVAGACVVLIIAALAAIFRPGGVTVLIGNARSPEARFFVSAVPELVGERLALESEDLSRVQEVVQTLRKGDHILYYDVADGVRFFAPFAVARGENTIELEWFESRLPSLYINAFYPNPETRSAENSREVEYFLYGRDGERLEYRGEISVSATVEEETASTHRYTIDWRVNIADLIDEGGRIEDIGGEERVRCYAPIFEDEHHVYFVEYTMRRGALNLNLYAWFTENKPEEL